MAVPREKIVVAGAKLVPDTVLPGGMMPVGTCETVRAHVVPAQVTKPRTDAVAATVADLIVTPADPAMAPAMTEPVVMDPDVTDRTLSEVLAAAVPGLEFVVPTNCTSPATNEASGTWTLVSNV